VQHRRGKEKMGKSIFEGSQFSAEKFAQSSGRRPAESLQKLFSHFFCLVEEQKKNNFCGVSRRLTSREAALREPRRQRPRKNCFSDALSVSANFEISGPPG